MKTALQTRYHVAIVVIAITMVVNFKSVSSSGMEGSVREKYLRGDLLDLRIEILSKAQTAQSLASNLKKIKVLEADRKICDLELERSNIPHRCYSVLNLERSLELINATEFRSALDQLDQICESLDGFEDPYADETDLNSLDVPSQRCQKIVDGLAKKQTYRLAERNPEKLFDGRFLSSQAQGKKNR